MAKAKATGEVMGVEFYVDEQWKFVVPELGSSHKSYDLMCDAIEKSHKEIEKSRKIKLDLEFLDAKGELFRVVGIHAGHGKPITEPKGKWEYHNYPNVPWIVEAMKERRRLSREAGQIGNAIERFSVGGGYGTRHTHEELQAEHSQKVRAANSITLAEAVKKYGGKGEIDF